MDKAQKNNSTQYDIYKEYFYCWLSLITADLYVQYIA
jgi:hypothetical protein